MMGFILRCLVCKTACTPYLALFPLSEISGICFLTANENQAAINNALQRLALRLMLYVPIGLGQNFKYLSKLSHKLIGNKILTESKEINIL